MYNIIIPSLIPEAEANMGYGKYSHMQRSGLITVTCRIKEEARRQNRQLLATATTVLRFRGEIAYWRKTQ